MDPDHEVRGILGAYRDAMQPDAQKKEASWRAIAAATSVAAGAVASGAAAASASALRIKIGLAVIALGVVGGTGAWIARDALGTTTTAVREPPIATPEAPTPPDRAPAALAAAPIGVEPAEPTAESAEIESRLAEDASELVTERDVGGAPRPRARTRSDRNEHREAAGVATIAATGSPPEVPATAGGTLADELALLGEARRALGAHDAAAAIVALDRHAARFPSGHLAHEREVTRVSALCDAGRRDEAGRVARAAGMGAAITRALSRCAVAP